jgi:serine/threonine-protein kinase RsbT
VDDERRSLDAPGSLALPYARSQERVAREVCIPIQSDVDIVKARQMGRDLAADLSFSFTDLTLIATSISELARNIVLYAHQGDICLQHVEHGEKRGIVIIARDQGPGIPDIRRALQDGYSTSRSLGLGLPGVRRLMDEFDLKSEVGRGTTVTVKKWKR